MSKTVLREIIEMAFTAGHAAGVVDAEEERECDLAIGDIRAEWHTELDRLTWDAECKIRGA